MDQNSSARYLRALAGHFELRDWDYTRKHTIDHIRYVGDWSGYNRVDRRVKRAARALVRGGPRRGLRFRLALAARHLSRERNLPDGVLDGGSIITHWEETGEYLQLVQPSVGLLLADFLLAEPDHPHAVLIRAELDRLTARYEARARSGEAGN